MNTEIQLHTERCVELYGLPIDSDLTEPVYRSSYEQMRADLMLAVGMLIALNYRPQP